MIKHAIAIALSAFIGLGMATHHSTHAAQSKATKTNVSKARWTAGQCRARCDSIWMQGRDRSKCYASICYKYPER